MLSLLTQFSPASDRLGKSCGQMCMGGALPGLICFGAPGAASADVGDASLEGRRVAVGAIAALDPRGRGELLARVFNAGLLHDFAFGAHLVDNGPCLARLRVFGEPFAILPHEEHLVRLGAYLPRLDVEPSARPPAAMVVAEKSGRYTQCRRVCAGVVGKYPEEAIGIQRLVRMQSLASRRSKEPSGILAYLPQVEAVVLEMDFVAPFLGVEDNLLGRTWLGRA